MSRSRNTYHIQTKAENSFDVESIKIIQKRPKHGDIHPLDKKIVGGFLRAIPSKFSYKLQSVELSARRAKPGHPWGLYRPSEAKILLYSHPLKMIDKEGYAVAMALISERGFSVLAESKEENGNRFSIWEKAQLQLFYFEILAHELGYHYYNVTKFQKKKPAARFHEISAESNKRKILKSQSSLLKIFGDSREKKQFWDAYVSFANKYE